MSDCYEEWKTYTGYCPALQNWWSGMGYCGFLDEDTDVESWEPPDSCPHAPIFKVLPAANDEQREAAEAMLAVPFDEFEAANLHHVYEYPIAFLREIKLREET